jgi:A/G-specific adenine glycosylase
MPRQLPFGQTQVSETEFRATIDVDAAISCLEKRGIEDPMARIEAFVRYSPELLAWLESNGREYPWRTTTDPWEVYIAEILLQRTRGDAVASIYETFLDRFPTPQALYEAPEEEIRELVHSLGFVNHRTRTLQEIGKLFVEEHEGEVPDSIEELKRPWRAGDYSARACQLFARGEPLALVDSNFARVIERVLGYEMPAQPHKSDAVYELMDALTPEDPPLVRAFNLAILDLGAKICTSSDPNCNICPLQPACVYAENSEQITG